MTTTRLESRRVHLRSFEAADALSLYEAVEASRASLKRRLDWVADVKNLSDEKRYIMDAAVAEKKGSALIFGIFENRSKKLVGAAALTGMGDKARTAARIGFWVRVEKQDKGYATEISKILIAHGFQKSGLHRIDARLDPTNRSFRKVLKKSGMKYEGCLRSDVRINGRWVDQECWGLLKREWKP